MSTPIFTTTLPSSTPSSLCPGYKHVEEFGADHEYDDEEDEIYVTLDLGAAEPMLIPSSTTYRLIGLDTPTPFLQLSGTILQGKHESLLGTELLFTEAKDTQDRSKRHLSFTSTTSQRIRFREVLLKPKGSSSSSQVLDSSAPNLNPNDGDVQMDADGEAEIMEKPKRRRSRKKPTIAGDTADTSTATAEKPTRRKPTRKGKGKSKAVDPEDQVGNETTTTAKGKGKTILESEPNPNLVDGEEGGRGERDVDEVMQDDENVGAGALPQPESQLEPESEAGQEPGPSNVPDDDIVMQGV